ncbi:MAG: sulfotransferase domain-containing protein [Flavobacteriaceae bacterium]|nr:sulfotransferase domain-containing protein [Flavobacteriaceae bacterium]
MIKRIAIHSVPRSGSSWLGQIFNSSPQVNFKFQPLFSYAFKDALNLNSTKNEIVSFFEQIASSEDDFLNCKSFIKSGKYPKFSKLKEYTSIVYKEVRYHHLLKNLMMNDDELLVIGLIRNPKGVINSWLQAPREFKKGLEWDEDEEWLRAPKKNLNKQEEFNGFLKWVECLRIFEYLNKNYPNRFIQIHYDDLLENTEDLVHHIFDRCEIPWNDQTENFINNSRAKEVEDAYSVFKKRKVDDVWKDELDNSIVDYIDSFLTKNSLEKFI